MAGPHAAGGLGGLADRSAVYRELIQRGPIVPGRWKRRREDYRRWERGRAMDLGQMDVTGRSISRAASR